MKIITGIASILIILGALNWGLIGLFNINLVSSICGGKDSKCTKVVYTIIGLAGIYAILYSII